MFSVSMLPSLGVVTAALFIGMGCLGMGNGAIFQLVPQRFQQEIGMVTGIVGAAGNRRILPSEYPRNAEANYRYVFKRVPNLYRYCIFSARSAFVCSGRMEKQWKAEEKSIRI